MNCNKKYKGKKQGAIGEKNKADRVGKAFLRK